MNRHRLWLLLPEPIRRLPADLAATAMLVVITDLSVLLPVVSETPLRIIFGLPFLLFIPGYAFIAALFPEAGTGPAQSDQEEERETNQSGIDGIERVALSFGLSIAIVPLLGLVLNFTPWGIRLVPILLSVSGFTIIATAVAAVRRRELPADERFQVPYRAWVASGRAELFAPESRMDGALNVLLVMSILLAVGSVGYAVAVPKQGEAFTEFYLLTENETGGLVADDYPTELVTGETRPLVVGIGNHEHEAVEYTVVVKLQDVRFAGNESTVQEDAELQRFRTAVPANETWTRNYDVQPTMTGDRLRLAFLLYNESVPSNPTVENAYRETHLWVNVSEAGTTENS
jgi:uncharacterized membrane protein